MKKLITIIIIFSLIVISSYSQSSTNVICPLSDCPPPLPVSFVKMQLNIIGKNIQLTWYTSSEVNNSCFVIERSSEGDFWNEVGTVPGNGTTNIEQVYNWVDYSSLTGVIYYRLLQIDYDGTTTFLSIVKTTMNFNIINGVKVLGDLLSIHTIQDNSTVKMTIIKTDKKTYKILN